MPSCFRTAMLLPLTAAILSGCSYGSTLCAVDTDCLNGQTCLSKTCVPIGTARRDGGVNPRDGEDAGPMPASAYYCFACTDDSDCGGTDNATGISSNGDYCVFGACAIGCATGSDCPPAATCARVTTPSGTPIGDATACRPSSGSCSGDDGGEVDSGQLDSGQPDSGPLDGGPTDAGLGDGGSLDAGPMGCLLDAGICSGSTPTCDPATGACTACLPTQMPNPCPAGEFCGPMGTEYGCVAGCNTVNDCAPVADGGVACCNNECVATASNAFNCGACGMACPSGDQCCGGSCANEQSDPNNCGRCGNACGSVVNANSTVCSTGTCTTTCDTGYTSCSNACVDITSDPGNCSGCGKACPSGDSCINSVCGCATGDVMCNGACSNTTTDPHNCGVCGNVCPSGAKCAAGVCQELCGGATTNPQTDPNNCGRCGVVCSNVAVCCGGKCFGADTQPMPRCPSCALASATCLQDSDCCHGWCIPTACGAPASCQCTPTGGTCDTNADCCNGTCAPASGAMTSSVTVCN